MTMTRLQILFWWAVVDLLLIGFFWLVQHGLDAIERKAEERRFALKMRTRWSDR
jgi:hypothetical protein